jgi:hypothetical protein
MPPDGLSAVEVVEEDAALGLALGYHGDDIWTPQNS